MRISLRMTIVGAALAALMSGELPVQAGPLGSAISDFNDHYQQNLAWPMPYIPIDREAVSAPFAVMIQKGWQEQNILGGYHFKADSNQLTEAGQLKVREIMTQVPQAYRTVYVERGNTPEETADRVAAARSYAEKIAIGNEVPDVRETDMVPHGVPAEYIDAINVKFQSTTPAPRLPADSSAAGTSGGSSGGSQ